MINHSALNYIRKHKAKRREGAVRSFFLQSRNNRDRNNICSDEIPVCFDTAKISYNETRDLAPVLHTDVKNKSSQQVEMDYFSITL